MQNPSYQFSTTTICLLATAGFDNECDAIMHADNDKQYDEGKAEYWAGTPYNIFWSPAKCQGYKDERGESMQETLAQDQRIRESEHDDATRNNGMEADSPWYCP